MILCCGEALIDMLPRTTTLGEPAFAPYVGGAVFNTAIALGRLGAPAGFFRPVVGSVRRPVPRGAGGKQGQLHLCAHLPRPTTLAFVRLTNGQATYTFYDENTAGRMLTTEDLPELGAEIEAMLFGAISLISDPAGAAYEEFMKREHQRRVMMLDPNIRPNFIPDKARHLRRIRSMMAMADIVKLSDEDLHWFGEAGSHEDVIRNWLDRGPKLIVVTHGSEGAVGYSREHKVTVMPQKVEVVDTVGAGDTFNAGILASLHEQGLLTKAEMGGLSEDAIRQALALGSKAAAVTVSRAGANPPWRHEIA